MKVWVVTGQDVQDPEVFAEDNLSFLDRYEEDDWESFDGAYRAGDGWLDAQLTKVEEN